MSAPSRCNLRNHPHTTWMQGTRLQMAATTTTIPSQNKACLVKQRSKKVNKLDDMFAYACRIYTNICLCSIHMYIPLHTWACMYECPVMWCNVACMYIIYMCVCLCYRRCERTRRFCWFLLSPCPSVRSCAGRLEVVPVS